MLSASKMRGPCSRCRQDLLHLFEYGFAGSLTARRVPSSMGSAPSPAHYASRRSMAARHRTLFTSASLRQSQQTPTEPPQEQNQNATEETPEPPSESLQLPVRPEGDATPEEIEAFVRETKATFRDTLPPHFLYEEEYKVYVRLFGPPLRETQPEDVGIGSALADGNYQRPLPEDHGGPKLLKENDQGVLEEVKYTPNPGALTENVDEGKKEEEVLVDVETFMNDPRIQYLQGIAKNRRQYEALLHLQADFEVASMEALKEEREMLAAQEAEEAAIEELEEKEAEAELEDPEEEALDSEEIELRHREKARMDEQWERHSSEGERFHPLTVEGQFGTKPSTVYISKKGIIEPITQLLKRTDIKHVKEAAESVFGGPELPFSARTPHNMKNAKQVGVALRATDHRMSEIDADAYISVILPTVYASATSILAEVRKRLGSEWLRNLMRKNDGQGPKILDAGGAGSGLLAWQHIMEAEWEAMKSDGIVETLEPPLGKRTALVGSNFLRHRVTTLLPNTTFIPRLSDYVHSAGAATGHIDAPAEPLADRKTYDVIIISHMLMPLDKQYKREHLLNNLWAQLNPDGGLLVVLEKGHPRGFEAVADVRARLLDEFIVPPGSTFSSKAAGAGVEDLIQPEGEGQRVREPGMIVAPCTNHRSCPMYHNRGFTFGRRDFCHFTQRFIRPPFLQRVLGGNHANHEDVNFSFLAVQRGGGQTAESSTSVEDGQTRTRPPAGPWQGKEATDRAFAGYFKQPAGEEPPSMLSLPRNVLPPLKRTGHVAMDVCTPDGTLERWTVPKSLGKQEYHDARKAQWGDLWALGAKQRESRPVRLGKPGTEVLNDRANPLGNGKKDGGVRVRRAMEQAQARHRADMIDIGGPGESAKESAIKRGKQHRLERRTKGGRMPPRQAILQEMREEEEDEEDDEDVDMTVRRPRRGKRRMRVRREPGWDEEDE